MPKTTITKALLTACRTGLEQARDAHIAREDEFHSNVLPIRLEMGLHALKAHCHFAATNPAKRGQGRIGKNSSPRDVISFEGWLKHECPWLAKATAYKYMDALHGLGLDEKATPEQVSMTLDTLRAANEKAGLPAPSLASLVRAAALRITDQDTTSDDPPPQQTEFEFMKTALSSFREQAESLLRIVPDLKGHPSLHRASCARVYGMLRELTGTDWQPSTTPDELATIDPDSITI